MGSDALLATLSPFDLFMIGFGELRRIALEWQTEISVVERVFAIDWLLKGLFDRRALRDVLTLRGGAALGKAYFQDYPPIEDVDLTRGRSLDDLTLERELGEAARGAAAMSGLSFKLYSLHGNEARFEYVGPLGRRSAAQPRVPLHFYSAPLRAEAVRRQMLHPFTDPCQVTVQSVSLEEAAAERIAAIGHRPRAREMFDLWFILSRGNKLLDRTATRALAESIAGERGKAVHAVIDPAYRPFLERAWESGLKQVRSKPSFLQAESEISENLAQILA